MPMTISEITEVPRQRRNDRWPSPFQMVSSSSECSPLVYRRSRYQATPPNAPAISRELTRRMSEACSMPCWRLPE